MFEFDKDDHSGAVWCQRKRYGWEAACRGVIGDEFYELQDQIDQSGWNSDNPESRRDAVLLFRRQFELFRAGYERLRSHPEQ